MRRGAQDAFLNSRSAAAAESLARILTAVHISECAYFAAYPCLEVCRNSFPAAEPRSSCKRWRLRSVRPFLDPDYSGHRMLSCNSSSMI